MQGIISTYNLTIMVSRIMSHARSEHPMLDNMCIYRSASPYLPLSLSRAAVGSVGMF